MSVRAFQLVPAIERVQLQSERGNTEIECIECCGKNLYIGTTDCFVVHYVIEEKALGNGKVSQTSQKQGHRYLALKKPISQLKAASALNRIMVLCDHTLFLLNMFDLEPIVGGAKIKGVTSFCLNENPIKSNPFSVEICVTLKKKQIQVHTVTEDRLIPIRDVSIPEMAVAVSMDGASVCVGMLTQYVIVDYEANHTQDLFPFDSERTKPLVTRISKDEFLLSAPSALGMFAKSSGISQRPPLQWSENLISVVYSHPYILALSNEFITIHSILDQQQKQSIPFNGGRCMGEFDGRIFISTSREIYGLVPIALEKQIEALLADKRTTEALDLAKNARKSGLTKEQFIKMYRRIQQQCGFIEFSKMNFDDSRDLFLESKLDIRELITLYPHVMPASSSFVRCHPPLHEIADINQLSRGKADNLKEFKLFLVAYLNEINGTKLAHGFQMEIDTALVKLYADTDPSKLLKLISGDNVCDISDCATWLQKFHQYHAQALLYNFHAECDKALALWKKIVDDELKDASFPGLEFVVNILSNLKDHQIVWKYAEWLLEINEILGVKIFTQRPKNDPQTEKMRPDIVLEFLARFGDANIVYLEYLVFTLNLQKEKYHTHLAVLYLDQLLRLNSNKNCDDALIAGARSKLRNMLQVSNLYRVQLLLGKVKETEMHAECAILYGKLGDHDKALRILVNKLRDYTAAETYCVVNSQGQEDAFRKRLFQILLTVYLDSNNERHDSMVVPAVKLLNNNQNDFDVIKVLQIIPDNWSIGLLHGFLISSVRKSLNQSRMKRVQCMLSRGENLQVRSESIDLIREQVTMTESKLCEVCNRGFLDATFARYPNGILCHINCAKNKNICPITGKVFGILSHKKS